MDLQGVLGACVLCHACIHHTCAYTMRVCIHHACLHTPHIHHTYAYTIHMHTWYIHHNTPHLSVAKSNAAQVDSAPPRLWPVVYNVHGLCDAARTT